MNADPDPERRKDWTKGLPFPRHWLAYLILKIAVLAGAVFIVLYLTGLIA